MISDGYVFAGGTATPKRLKRLIDSTPNPATDANPWLMGLLMGLFGAVRYATRTSGEAEGHQDFQSYSPVRVSARKCLLSQARITTVSCAGVCWSDQECA